MSLIDARGEIPLILQSAKAGQNTSLQRNLFGQIKRNEGLELLEQAGGAHFNEFALSILESTVCCRAQLEAAQQPGHVTRRK
jgi:hypothetical protein